MVCALFLFLLLVTENIYLRSVFVLIGRAAIFGAFATVYLWTPLVIPPQLRTSAMGLVSSFGKIASICAPFISSSFSAEDILVPVMLFGVVAFFCAGVMFFVGVEPPEIGTEKISDDETSPLIKSNSGMDDKSILI